MLHTDLNSSMRTNLFSYHVLYKVLGFSSVLPGGSEDEELPTIFPIHLSNCGLHDASPCLQERRFTTLLLSDEVQMDSSELLPCEVLAEETLALLRVTLRFRSGCSGSIHRMYLTHRK
jgi:hypothetical protein